MAIFGQAEFNVAANIGSSISDVNKVVAAIGKLGTEASQATKRLDQMAQGVKFGQTTKEIDSLIKKIDQLQQTVDELGFDPESAFDLSSVERGLDGTKQKFLDLSDASAVAAAKEVAALERVGKATRDLMATEGERLKRVGAATRQALAQPGAAQQQLADSPLPEPFIPEGGEKGFARTREEIQALIKDTLRLEKEIADLFQATRTGKPLVDADTTLKELERLRDINVAKLVNVDPLIKQFGLTLPAAVRKFKDEAEKAFRGLGQANLATQAGVRVPGVNIPKQDSATKATTDAIKKKTAAEEAEILTLQKLGAAMGQFNKAMAAEQQLASQAFQRQSGVKLIDEKQITIAIGELDKLIKKILELQAVEKRTGTKDPTIAGLKDEAIRRARSLGQDVNFDQLAKGFAKPAKEVSVFDRALNSLNDKMGRFGLNVSGISVLLGAGFAGGLAGIIKIIVDLGTKIGGFIAMLQDVQRETRLTFGSEVASQIENFAERTAIALGRTESQMLKLANGFAALGKRLNLPAEDIDEFSVALADAAARLERSLPGFKDLEEVQSTMAAAINGSEEALRNLGIDEDEEIKKSIELFGVLPSTLSKIEKGMLAVKLITDEAAESFENTGRVSASSMDKLKNIIEGIGEALGDLANHDQNEIASDFNEVTSALSGVSTALGWLQRTTFEELFSNDTELVADRISKLSDKQIAEIKKQASEAIILTDENAEAQKIILDAIEKETQLRHGATDATKKQADAVDALRIAHERNVKEFLKEISLQQQATDLILAKSRAEEDGALRIEEALIRLGRAREEAAIKEDKTRLDNQRATEDANRRLGEANRELERARVDRERKLRDFTIEHNRKSEDLNREHNRKLEDFARKEKEIQDERVRSNIEALIALQNAQFDFNTRAFNEAQRRLAQTGESTKKTAEDLALEKKRELEDFERETAREKKDRIRELGDIEIDTNRQIFDANQRVKEALIERQRAFEDSMIRLRELELENSRLLEDAQRQLEAAQRESKRAIDDASKALDRFALSVRLSVDEIKELLNQIERVKNINWDTVFDWSMPFSPGFVVPEQQRASGGSIWPGSPFLVGEKGPEVIIPKGWGEVIPNGKFGQAQQPVNITVNEVANDPEATAFAVWARTLNGVNQ